MSLDDATAFITHIIVGTQQHYVSTSVPDCHQPTVWWNCYCHQSFWVKMRAWESGDQLGYQCARQIVRRTQALALYKDKVISS